MCTGSVAEDVDVALSELMRPFATRVPRPHDPPRSDLLAFQFLGHAPLCITGPVSYLDLALYTDMRITNRPCVSSQSPMYEVCTKILILDAQLSTIFSNEVSILSMTKCPTSLHASMQLLERKAWSCRFDSISCLSLFVCPREHFRPQPQSVKPSHKHALVNASPCRPQLAYTHGSQV